MKKTLYLYRLTDTQGNQTITVADNTEGTLYFDGYDREYKYRNLVTSTRKEESFYPECPFKWAEKHGMKLESGTMEIDVPDSIFSV